MSRQPHGQLTSSTPELRAQLNLTNDQKRRVTIPASMACAWNPHVAIVGSWKCSSNVEKRRLSRLQTTSDREADHLKELKPHGGLLFQHTLHDRQVKHWKRPTVALYLDELPIQKCQFRDRFNVSIFSLERLSPRGSCHLDESSMNHTLAQKYLIELLMWNASYVQKHSS